jgi:hypothetical protein
MVWATFWVTFSQTHLATLFENNTNTYRQQERKLLRACQFCVAGNLLGNRLTSVQASLRNPTWLIRYAQSFLIR